MNNFKETWTKTTLGCLFNHRKERGNVNEVLLSITGSKGVVRRDSLERRDTSNKDKSKYLLVKKGDIVYNTMRMWQGVSGVSLYKGIVSPAYTVCSPNDNIDSTFAGFFLKDPAMVSLFRKRSQGLVSDTWNLKYEKFAEISCSIPPLLEQKKIAEILSYLEAEIETLINKKEKYIQILEAISAEIFHDLKINFSSERLIGVCSLITKGATPTSYGYKLSNKRFPNCVSFLGGGNASKDGKFIFGPERFCSSEATKFLLRSELKEGDSLVTIVGYVGNTCLVPADVLPANINQNIALVRANPNYLNSDYLHLFLTTEGRKQLQNIITTQAQPSVSLKQVGELHIPIPKIEEQYKINKVINSITKLIENLDKKIRKKEILKKGLSSDLLSGFKRVNI